MHDELGMEGDYFPDDAFDENAADAPMDLGAPIFSQPDSEDIEPGPGDEGFIGEQAPSLAGPAADLSNVLWPDDGKAPDYAYLADVAATDEFLLTQAALLEICKANSYMPYQGKKLVAFALRGAMLDGVHEAVMQNAIRIKVTRPDHRNFRCLIGFWHLDIGKLTLFTGSTVPCRAAVAGYASGGEKSNMLPTGLYTTYVWRHKNLKPALRMSRGNASEADLEAGSPVAVLRSQNNTVIETTDPFKVSVPYDNVHCSYYLNQVSNLGACFSSWGCLTVRGMMKPSDQWKKFQQILLQLGMKNRIDLIVATGKDAALAEDGKVGALRALRQGSQGDQVAKLQQALGLSRTGMFGAVTADKLTTAQRAFNNQHGKGPVADCVFTPDLDAQMGLGVFSGDPFV